MNAAASVSGSGARDVPREHGDRGDFIKGLYKTFYEPLLQLQKGMSRDGVFEARDRRLTGQVSAIRRAVCQQLEDGIAAQRVMSVLVGIPRQNAKHASPDNLQRRMCGSTALVSELFGELLGEPQLFIELTENQKPSIAGEIVVNCFYANRLFGEKIELQ